MIQIVNPVLIKIKEIAMIAIQGIIYKMEDVNFHIAMIVIASLVQVQ